MRSTCELERLSTLECYVSPTRMFILDSLSGMLIQQSKIIRRVKNRILAPIITEVADVIQL
jgi:uncharacterized coiled-coil protein SlyX